MKWLNKRHIWWWLVLGELSNNGGQEWVIGGLYIIKNKQESSDSFMKRQKGFNEFNGCQVQYQGLQLHPFTLQMWYKIVDRIRNQIRNFSYIHGLNWTKCCIMWICTINWSWNSIATNSCSTRGLSHCGLAIYIN